jgi:hypothetical protein
MKRLWLPRITLARTETAQAIQFVKGRFFDRIRAFADSLNPPAAMADDNNGAAYIANGYAVIRMFPIDTVRIISSRAEYRT